MLLGTCPKCGEKVEEESLCVTCNSCHDCCVCEVMEG